MSVSNALLCQFRMVWQLFELRKRNAHNMFNNSLMTSATSKIVQFFCHSIDKGATAQLAEHFKCNWQYTNWPLANIHVLCCHRHDFRSAKAEIHCSLLSSLVSFAVVVGFLFFRRSLLINWMSSTKSTYPSMIMLLTGNVLTARLNCCFALLLIYLCQMPEVFKPRVQFVCDCVRRRGCIGKAEGWIGMDSFNSLFWFFLIWLYFRSSALMFFFILMLLSFLFVWFSEYMSSVLCCFFFSY